MDKLLELSFWRCLLPLVGPGMSSDLGENLGKQCISLVVCDDNRNLVVLVIMTSASKGNGAIAGLVIGFVIDGYDPCWIEYYWFQLAARSTSCLGDWRSRPAVWISNAQSLVSCSLVAKLP